MAELLTPSIAYAYNEKAKVIAQQRQQESEVMQIESDINISNHDRR